MHPNPWIVSTRRLMNGWDPDIMDLIIKTVSTQDTIVAWAYWETAPDFKRSSNILSLTIPLRESSAFWYGFAFPKIPP